ncbi:MAG TPA: LptE family protein [Candidatus Acidoferrales bacterium]|nr:LptE family protein [Candidatus Acidoferrales bacterium]
MRLLAAVVPCIFFVASGCGYHVIGRGGQLPAEWQTLAVPIFTNQTPAYRIEQRVTNAVIHELLVRTKYRVVPSPAGANAVLRGDITDIEVVPLLFDASSGHVTTFLVTLKLKVNLVDESAKKSIYRNNNFIFRDEYQVSNDVNALFQEEDPAFERMSRKFASDLVSALLEGF